MQQERHFGDEIELMDILRVLWKRKFLIVLGTLLLTIAAAGCSYFLPKIYAVTTIIEPGKRPISNENGQIIDEKVLESPNAIKEAVVGGAFDDRIRTKLQISVEKFPEVKVSVPKGTELIKLSVESSEPKEAVAVLSEIVSMISADIEKKIAQEKSQIESDIKLALMEYQGGLVHEKLLEGQIAETKQTIKSMEVDRKKAMASPTTDVMAVLLYSNEIQDNLMYLSDLYRNLNEMEKLNLVSGAEVERLKLKSKSIKATRVHKVPAISPRPVRPKKALIVAMAFMLALMGTTMTAFLLEYVQSANRREAEAG